MTSRIDPRLEIAAGEFGITIIDRTAEAFFPVLLDISAALTAPLRKLRELLGAAAELARISPEERAAHFNADLEALAVELGVDIDDLERAMLAEIDRLTDYEAAIDDAVADLAANPDAANDNTADDQGDDHAA